LDGTNPAADGERDEDLVRGAADDVQHRATAFLGRGDIQEGQLVGALFVVALCELHRVASVTQVLKVHALDDAAVRHVQARNDAPTGAHASPPGSTISCAVRAAVPIGTF